VEVADITDTISGAQGEASVSCWSFYSRSFSLGGGVFDIPRRISSFRQGFGRAWDDVPAETTCLPFGAIGETNSAFLNEVGTCLVRVATHVSDAKWIFAGFCVRTNWGFARIQDYRREDFLNVVAQCRQ